MSTSLWKTSKEALFSALSTLELVPTRPGIPASEYIKAERGKNGFVNLQIASEISGFAPLKGEGEWPAKVWFIDRRLLMPFITAGKTLSKSDFEFSLRNDELCIRHGLRKVSFTKSPDVPGYGDLPASFGGAVTLSRSSLALIACAREFASGDPTTPELNCVFIEPSPSRGDLRIYAATKSVIYSAKSGEKVKMPHSLPMPPFIVSLLTNEHLKKIYWTKREIVLEFTAGRVWQSTSVKAAKFPVKAVQGYFKDALTYKEIFHVDSRVFAAAISRLGVYLTAVRREDWLLVIKGEKGSGKLRLTSTVPQAGFNEVIKGCSLSEDVELLWPLSQLLPMYTFLSSRKKEGDLSVCLDPDGRAFVKTKHIQVIVPKKAKGKKK
jgi:hypothetical protein